jgi:hypothetical protein
MWRRLLLEVMLRLSFSSLLESSTHFCWVQHKCVQRGTVTNLRQHLPVKFLMLQQKVLLWDLLFVTT